MSAEENIASMRRAYEAFSSGDLDVLDELAVPGFVDHNPEPDQGPGAQGVKESFARFRTAVPDLRVTVQDIIAAGDKVVARAIMSGTDQGGMLPGAPPSGKRFSIEVIDIVRFEGGKAVERWGLHDGLGLLQQIGAIPEPAQA